MFVVSYVVICFIWIWICKNANSKVDYRSGLP